MAKITQEDKRTLGILHLALSGGVLIILVVIYYLISSGSGEIVNSYSTMYFRISAVLVLLGMLASTKIYQTNINHASSKSFDSYEHAFTSFRAVNIVRWAFIEGPTLIAIILGFLDKNIFGLVLGLVGLLFLYVAKPNEEHFAYYSF